MKWLDSAPPFVDGVGSGRKRGGARRLRAGRSSPGRGSGGGGKDARPRALLHPRNSFRGSYDLDALVRAYPPLGPHVILPPCEKSSGSGEPMRPTIDFSDSVAVRCLNCALLVRDYGLSPVWADIMPSDTLVPPIPGRADYVHHLADILRECTAVTSVREMDEGKYWSGLPTGPGVRVLDLGTGASCVYPLIGASIYGWSFIASEVHLPSFKSAHKIVDANSLSRLIDVRRQDDPNKLFEGIWRKGELIDFVMCNPPFYGSAEAFQKENARKVRNLASNVRSRNGLGGRRRSGVGRDKRVTGGGGGSNNFGGSASELWCPGGEVAFVTRMIEESAAYADRCLWFSSLVSRRDNLPKILEKIRSNTKQVQERDMRIRQKDAGKRKPGYGPKMPKIQLSKTLTMGPGSKSASVVLWSYWDADRQKEWGRERKWTTTELETKD